MRILVTNDDGISAPGLQVLIEAAKKLTDDVWVCAPLNQQSCSGHSITLSRPLRIHKYNEKQFAIDGTPGDNVLIALNKIMPEKPDLVLSGVNFGLNIGHDVTYSGTVAAAMEGTLLRVRSIAFSAGVDATQQAPIWETPKKYIAQIIKDLTAMEWPSHTLMNVNFPVCAPDQVTGMRLTHHLDIKMSDEVIEREDRWGQPYYWVGHSTRDAYTAPDSDVAAIAANAIAITPIKIDMTDYDMLKKMQESLSDSFTSRAA